MSFLAPWAAWFLAGIPLIVLLYLLKQKRRSLPVSTLMFWNRVLQESRRRALFQRLRNVLSLLLHLLIFLLIVGALAKPTLDRFIRAGSSTVLILDSRARMQAVDEDGVARFEKARSLALAASRGASEQRQYAVLELAAAPRVLVPFTGDEKLLRETLDGIKPTDAHGDMEKALQLARDLLSARKGESRIVVYTDGKLPGRTAELGPSVEVIPIGKSRDNVAITRFTTRPLLSSPETSEVLLELRNFGNAEARGNVEVSLDGRLLDVKPYTLTPGQQRLEIFPSLPSSTRTPRGWLTAQLDAQDALALDNIAFAVLPAPPKVRVLLVSKGNWFLEKLLAADSRVSFELLGTEAFKVEMAKSFDVVILDNTLSSGIRLAEIEGNFLFIQQSPFAVPGEQIEQPVITESLEAHPLMRLVALQNVTIARAARMELPSMERWSFETPLRSFDHPLLLTGERLPLPGQNPLRVVALAFDVAASDLPLRIAFPLLMANTIHWLAGEEAAPALSLRAGETIALSPDQSVSTTPAVQTVPDAKSETPISTVFRPMENGFYRTTKGNSEGWIAVNTFSEAESDLRTSESPAEPPSATATFTLRGVGAWPLWLYFALAALLLFTLEWWLFHRRRTE